MIHSLLGAATILLVAAKRQPTLHRPEGGFLAEHRAIARKYRALRRSRAAKLSQARPTTT